MATKQMEKDGFAAATEAEGLKTERTMYPFVDLTDKAGNWLVGNVTKMREAKFTPKKGKNKGKAQEAFYIDIEVEQTNIAGLGAGDMGTVSAPGLLEYQFTKGLPVGLSVPFKVGIKYLGKDDEGRHQTEVRFPSKA